MCWERTRVTKLHPQSETVCSSKSCFAEEKKALKSEYAWEKRVKLQNAYIACIGCSLQQRKEGGGGGEGGREGEGGGGRGREEGQNEGGSG